MYILHNPRDPLFSGANNNISIVFPILLFSRHRPHTALQFYYQKTAVKLLDLHWNNMTFGIWHFVQWLWVFGWFWSTSRPKHVAFKWKRSCIRLSIVVLHILQRHNRMNCIKYPTGWIKDNRMNCVKNTIVLKTTVIKTTRWIVLKIQQDELYWRHNRTNCIKDTTGRTVLDTTGRTVLKTQQDELYWRHNMTNCIKDTTGRTALR